MKSKSVYVFVLVLVLAAIAVVTGCNHKQNGQPSTKSETLTSVRVGWMTSLAIQGQQVQALKHSDILKRNGLEGHFTAFTYGPPQVEAAIAGSLDVVTLGTVPMLTLLSKSDDWVIVSRHANVRFGLLVPQKSSASTLADLKGKKIAVSIGSSAEQFILNEIQAAGLSPADFDLVNIGPEEQGELARSGSGTSWGDIFALVSWDPTLSLIENEGHVHLLKERIDLTWLAFSKKFIREHPDAALAYLRSTIQAWQLYATNRNQMNDFYREDAKLPIDSSILEKIAASDRNTSATAVADVDIGLTADSLKRLSESVAFLRSKGRLDSSFSLEAKLDKELFNRARQGL
jgi:sulfonate transport system substrate-binding protein